MELGELGDFKIGEIIGQVQQVHGKTYEPVGNPMFEVIVDVSRFTEDLELAKKSGGSLPGGFRGTKIMTQKEYDQFIAQNSAV